MTWAYDFECDTPILGILAALNRAGPWRWVEWNKEAFGTYLTSQPFEGVRARIYSDPRAQGDDGPRYTADFWLGPGAEVPRDAIEAAFRGMLAAVSARNVAPGEYWD
jgi:hypothetical protein